MRAVPGSVTAPKGFVANGVKSGIKEGKLDLALILSVAPALAAGIFTVNRIKAAPVRLTEERVKNGTARAILANSGNANCLTGKGGVKGAMDAARAVAAYLRIGEREVLVASTGIIGKPLPVERIRRGIPALVNGLSKAGGDKAARAILTTDTRPKEIAVEAKISGRAVRIGAIAKGAGMINPRMATMLCFITTDADIEPAALKRSLTGAAEGSFNSITVDGDMSTNDTVLILANGLAGNLKIRCGTASHKIFSDALSYVASHLAREIVKDAEGATKFIEIEVRGAATERDAEKVARQVANSNLVKTAISGEDPNIGRIAAACGASGVEFDASRLDIYLGAAKIVSDGNATHRDTPRLKKLLRQREINIALNLNKGRFSKTIWTCDLSEEYVKINARYN